MQLGKSAIRARLYAKIGKVRSEVPRPKVWQYQRWVSEHAFDKLRLIDCTFAEFAVAAEEAEIIEERSSEGTRKQLLLVQDWRQPLHVVVVVDDRRREERIITIYEPDPDQWSADYRRRR